jgi:hypothetical protein
MYERFRQMILEETRSGKHIHMDKRIQLGVLFNVETDPTLIPDVMLALQSTYQPQQPPQGPGPGPTGAPVDISRPPTENQNLELDQ